MQPWRHNGRIITLKRSFFRLCRNYYPARRRVPHIQKTACLHVALRHVGNIDNIHNNILRISTRNVRHAVGKHDEDRARPACLRQKNETQSKSNIHERTNNRTYGPGVPGVPGVNVQ
ncbi:hypothetical protein CVT25_011024 [Psilocybe cyanescens]|uniref:Uncharacterized protein n=1 Tax=Psilocybe cyanescens TaxID=93625 RepID=A0A409WG12_PSICY|nr:hypothetical protein CVT25_011024 [Psilocybe cyanescens]